MKLKSETPKRPLTAVGNPYDSSTSCQDDATESANAAAGLLPNINLVAASQIAAYIHALMSRRRVIR